jgi:hypothetical protein
MVSGWMVGVKAMATVSWLGYRTAMEVTLPRWSCARAVLATAYCVCAALHAPSAVAAQSPDPAADTPATGAPAEDAPAGSAPAPAGENERREAAETPFHVVRLEDGTEYRGTISELVPDSHLLLIMVTGETKRLDLKEVARVEAAAGASTTSARQEEKPADTAAAEGKKPEAAGQGRPIREPGAPPEPGAPLITVHGEKARLRFTADRPHLTFHVGTGVDRRHGTVVGVTPYPYNDWFMGSLHSVGDRFDRICTAPCEASMPAGTYRIAVSTPDSGLLVLDDPLQVSGSGFVEGAYRSNAGIRTAGWITGGGSLLVGLTLTIIGYADRSEEGNCAGGACEENANTALVISGLAVAFTGMLAGAIMVAVDDEASIRFTPAKK